MVAKKSMFWIFTISLQGHACRPRFSQRGAQSFEAGWGRKCWTTLLSCEVSTAADCIDISMIFLGSFIVVVI